MSIFISCKEADKKDSNKTEVLEIKEENLNPQEILKNKSQDTLIYQDDKLISKSEFTMYGDGVVNLNINNEVIIYNQDESVFGKIFFSEESESFVIDMPKEIKARYFVPILEQFSFDAIRPKENDSYLNIFINSEIKKIKKEKINFNFFEWDNYLKESFINIRRVNNKDQVDNNTYKVLNIEKDSILIKSISKTECDLIEESKNISKKVKWKEDNLLLISFFECN